MKIEHTLKRFAAKLGEADGSFVTIGNVDYHFAPGGYASAQAERMGRVVQPGKETVTLEDYRRRYAQYRSDPDLQALHAAHPKQTHVRCLERRESRHLERFAKPPTHWRRPSSGIPVPPDDT